MEWLSNINWADLILVVGSLAMSIYVYIKNKNLTGLVNKLQESLKNNKVLYVVCPNCGNKVYITLENVKEESEDVNI